MEKRDSSQTISTEGIAIMKVKKERGIIGYVQPDWVDRLPESVGYTLISVLEYQNQYYTQKVKIIREKDGVVIREIK